MPSIRTRPMRTLRPLALLALLAPLMAIAPASAETVLRGDCSLTVDGRARIAVRRTCPIYRYDGADGIFMINTDGRTRIRGFFAQVTPNGDGTASISWNASRRAQHAHDFLGEDFHRRGDCWVNRRARLCATRRR